MTHKHTNIWHCLWGLPFLLAGGSYFFYAIFHGLGHLTDSLTQVVVPGRAELSLQQGRRYTVFLEEQSVVDNKVYSSTQSIVGLECRVKSLENGSQIGLEKPNVDASYSLGGRSGHAVLEFSIQQSGKYEFACDYDENRTGPEVVVAVGSGVSEAIFRTVGTALAAFFGGIGGALVVLITVLVKRGREKKITDLGEVQV